jgi:mRNA interferase MazF
MTPRPKIGDVFVVDLGYEGKARPVVVMSREDPEAPRAVALCVPLTSQHRGSPYEVTMPRVPWLRLQSYANAQGIGSVGFHELTDKRGRFEPAAIAKIKDAIRFAFDL